MSDNQDSKLKIAWKTASGAAYGAGIGLLLGLLGNAPTISSLIIVSGICAAIGGLFSFSDAVDKEMKNDKSDDDKPSNNKGNHQNPQPRP